MVQTPARRRFEPAEVATEPRVAMRYRIENTLGRGGMGSVFKVFDESLGAHVALKRPIRRSPKDVALFEREFHTLSGIRHPHIIEVYDYGTDGEGPFYTMELLSGSDLSKIAPLPWEETCRVLREAASGLALLHARRLIHRDLSQRNLWRCSDGRIKLIDFGALAAFGRAPDVAGTPPFIAPEALHGQPLDQRTDLFALGALGYWLLSGRHAFPARELYELSELWRRSPRSPSSCVAHLERGDLPQPPAALDELIEALLSRDPLGRPASAGEVIDRLVAIARLPPEKNAYVVASYLGSAAFVGRHDERAQLSAALNQCQNGHGTSLMLEAESGFGRTRLLNEFALEARLKGFAVLQTDAQERAHSHGAACALALRALSALPTLAKSSAAPHAATLGHVSPELLQRLGLTPGELSAMPQAPGEARMRIQAALRAWFLAMARAQPLAILVDDLEAIDEASAAWLAALAHEVKGARLLIVAGLRTDYQVARGHAVEVLRQQATRLSLSPLSYAETREILRSMFGDAPHVERVSELLYRIAQGSPAHTMELAEHLVRSNGAIYLNGSWVLPQNLEEGQLPATRGEMLAARLRRLPASARLLGQVLSVHADAIPVDICAALSERSAADLFGTLEILVKEGVLTGAADGYRFCHEGLRRTLLAELEPERSRRAHKLLGRLLLDSGALSTLQQLEAGVHLLLGGDTELGSRVVSEAALRLGLTELTELGPAAPWLSEALVLYRELKRPEAEQVALLAPLALAGYYVNRKLADRHGDEAVAMLAQLLRLPLARRLRPFLGRKLSLWIALIGAFVGFRRQAHNPRVPSFRDAVVLLFNCVAALTGVATICINPERAKSLAQVIEPLTALGKRHVASLMFEFCKNLAATVQDRIGEAYERWTFLLERLESNQPIQNLPDNLRVFYLAGALYARGVIESWRDDSRALDFANRLDALRLRLYEMSADQIRMMYFGNQGNMELFEHYRQRVELHAIQRGTAWQAETWASGAAATIYLRTYDAARMRQAEEQLQLLSREVPSLHNYAVRARGCLLMLRGQQAEALPDLEAALKEPVQGIVGWGRSHGALARAYNELGAHSRAREVARSALAVLSPLDLEFPAMNLGLQIEAALADAGLGQHAAAARELDALLEKHRPYQGPLTLGALHEARARVAQLAGAEEDAARHLAEMQRWYRATGIPSLVERCDRLEKQMTRAGRPDSVPVPGPTDSATIVEAVRQGGTGSRRAIMQWSLEKIVQQFAEPEGYLFALAEAEGPRVAHVGEAGAALDDWAIRRLSADERVRGNLADRTVTDADETLIGGRRYRLLRLHAWEEGRETLVGGLVLPAESAFKVPSSLLHALASRLPPIALPTSVDARSAPGERLSGDGR